MHSLIISENIRDVDEIHVKIESLKVKSCDQKYQMGTCDCGLTYQASRDQKIHL